MEDNSQKPSAEEQDEPQNIPTTKEGIAPPEKSQEPTTPKEANEVPVAEKKEKTTELNTDETQEEPVDYSKFSIDELIEVYKELCTSDQWLKNHSQIQAVGTIFENKFHADVEANKKTFVEEGGNEIDFFYKPEYKKSFDQIGFEYRTKRRSHYKDQQASYKVNLERKKAIIEEIKSLIGADQNINTIYKTFRTLQESWYSTGPVSRADNHNLWETFKHHVERFYDFLHLNRELRELDYKHNYEEKLKIIERTEALKDVPDIIQASRDLNTLHQLWKNDLGPVAKEHREDLWKRFQDATKIIQARRQEYQKDIAGAMKENLEKKNALLKEMEILVENKPENHNGWQNALKKFNQLRETFKTIGQVPSKESKISWQRFRDVGRAFMHEKNIFYKNQKQEYNQNINAKKAFITQSKEILDSPEWDSKVQEMKNLQKDWKSIGFVPRKLDNKLWSEFSEIHKVFFDRIKSGYQRLSEEFGYDHEKIAHFMSKSRSHISNTLRLLTLPTDVIAMIEEGNLTAGQARPLIGIASASSIAEEIVARKLSARSVELLVRSKKDPQKIGINKIDSNIINEQKKIQDNLGLNVSIKNKKNNSGQITIIYKNLEQFDLISGLLKRN